MAPDPSGPREVPSLPVRGPGFWIPALALPLLLLAAAAAMFVLGSGLVAVILGGGLVLGAVSSLVFYASGIRRRRLRRARH